MDAVLPYPDFPILLETWRTCLQDEFDLENLKQLLDEIRSGQIRVTEATTTAASPFADGLIWKQTNTYMYEDDSPVSGKASGLSGELLKEVLFSSRLRPRIPEALIASLTAKLQRTAPGYAPRSAEDLLDWTKERLFIPRGRVGGADRRDRARSRDRGRRSGRIDPGEDRLHPTARGVRGRWSAPWRISTRIAGAFQYDHRQSSTRGIRSPTSP